jgi:uncharacterized membrane protein YcaP (DUF421 family)
MTTNMNKFINDFFGQGQDLTILQIMARGFVMFFITLFLIRVGGIRIFGKRSALDNIIAIIMGALLARGIVGVSPFFHTIAVSAIMVVLHRLLAWWAVKNKWVERSVKGHPIVLYKDGELIKQNLEKTTMSEADVLESLRLETNKRSLKDIEEVYMETNGRISFILK